MARKKSPMCAKCPTATCAPPKGSKETPSLDKAPEFCPMKLMPGVLEKTISEYDKPEIKEFARQAALQEFECFEQLPDGLRTKNPRILELIQFAQKCGYKKLGIAFCTGLANEANMLTAILEQKGFEVVSVRCKVGAIPKERIGIKPEEKIGGPGHWESMCSPIAQAEILNSENVDLAIMLGLCIGHDILFHRFCRVPTTVLAVKDRVTGHNPLAALYVASSFYPRLMAKERK